MSDGDAWNLKAAKLLPCWCDVAYTSRQLVAPDCPRCNFGEDVADALRELAIERDKALALVAGEDGTFMAAYSGEQLLGEECPVCKFPCDTRYAVVMGIGENKVAHLMCAYSIVKVRLAAAAALLERRPHIDCDGELIDGDEHHDYNRENDEACCAEIGGKCAK